MRYKPGQDILSTSAEIPDCIPHQSYFVTSLQRRCRTAHHGCGGASSFLSRPTLH